MTIIFEDDGQDFLEWDLDQQGMVIGCRPFQAWAWCGGRVLNAAGLKAGSEVRYETKSGDVVTLIHSVEEVR